VVSDAASTTEHVVKLTGLNPATQYYYSIGNSTATLAGGDGNYFFVTAPTPGTEQPTHMWVVGNSGMANAKARAVRDAYLNYKGSRNTDLWLMLGDNAYIDGTDNEYQAALFDMYPTLLRQTVLWPTLGDRDGHTADSASQSGPYYDIFTLPKQGEAGGVASGTEAYYSFDYANIHFIVLDSVETSRVPTGAMLTWLKNDLAATTQPWVIAYWHHSPYSKGLHDFNSEIRLREMRQNVLPILEKAGVDLVLSGHSGSYERSFLIDGHYGTSSTFDSATMLVDGGDGRIDGNGAYQKSVVESALGTVYAVTGGSQRSSRSSISSLNSPLMYVSLQVLGSMLLDVDGPTLKATFLDDAGQVRDHFHIVKTTSTAKASISRSSPTPSLDDAGQVRDHFRMVGTTSTAKASISRSSPTPSSIANVTNNLVAHWTLDTQNVDTSQSSAEVRDVSGYNNHSDLKNHGGTTVSGKLGQALSFDGIDDYAERISFSGLPTSAITVSAWIKLDAHKNWNRVVNHEWVNNGWLLFTDASGTAIFGVGQSGVQYNATKAGLTVGSWYHLVGVYDGSNVRIYVNGQEGTPRAKNGVTLDGSGNVDIGGAHGDRFKGAIDDVRIYNRAFTASEVVTLYNAGGTTDTTPPSSPTNLAATAVSSSQINLSWNASTDNVGVTGYRVFRCRGTGCTPATQIATVSGVSYSDTGLSPSTTYVYQLKAHDVAGNVSSGSSIASAKTQASSGIPTPIKTAPIVNVKNFGARGDGITDDTTAIQNAIDSMTSGGTLEFPTGTYKMSNYIKVNHAGIKLWGYGGATIHNVRVPVMAAVQLFGTDTALYGFNFTTVNITRSEALHALIEMRGNNQQVIDNSLVGPADLAGGGILTLGASDFLIARNHVENTAADAIWLVGGSHDGRVLKNVVRDAGDDMVGIVGYDDYPVNYNILVEKNDLSQQFWGRGIAVAGAKDVTIRNNKISHTYCCAGIYLAQEDNFHTYSTTNILVEGNTISHVQTTGTVKDNAPRTYHAGIQFWVQNSTKRVENVMLRNNTIDDAINTSIAVTSNACKVGLVNNKMTRIQNVAIDISSTVSSSCNVACSGNTDEGQPVSNPRCGGPLPSVTGYTQ
jgi:chitodextrinase